MNRLLRHALAAGLLGVGAVPLAAQEIEPDAIKQRHVEQGKASLEADAGYIFLKAPRRFEGVFLRLPDEEDIAAYEEERDAELAEAVEKYPGRLRRWERARERGSATGEPAGPRPEMPTRETVAMRPLELRGAISMGPGNIYAKEASGTYAYFHKVKPGRYVWYGPVIEDVNGGITGLCYCMGSIAFEVGKGKITNLGNYLYLAPQAADHVSASQEGPALARRAAKHAMLSTEETQDRDFALPATLAAWPAVEPDFHAAGKMNNFYTVIVDRLPPIDGVLAYSRDVVIDARTGQPANAFGEN